MALNTPEELISDIRLGKMVILMDDEDRENEGDLVMAAECVTSKDINFMITHARGLVCMPMSSQRCEQLSLPLMVSDPGCQHGTNFTLSIEAREGVTTGISAADRAHTVRTAVAKNAKPSDIVQPGHIFPLRAQDGGVLTRAGHTEAGCDLARLAGYEAAAVIVEIMNDDGSMARRPELEAFAEKHDLKIGTIADLIHYRVLHENTIEVSKQGIINTDFGEFEMRAYTDKLSGEVHIALIKGQIDATKETLVRVQNGSTFRDLFCSQPSESKGWNIQRCLRAIAEEGCGTVIVLANNESPESILSSVEIALGEAPTPRETLKGSSQYMTVGVGSQILREIGVGKIRLMGVPMKYNAISGFDLEVVSYANPEQFSF